MSDLGWWVIHGEDFLRDLHRVAEGENPDVVYMEAYANAQRPEEPGVPKDKTWRLPGVSVIRWSEGAWTVTFWNRVYAHRYRPVSGRPYWRVRGRA